MNSGPSDLGERTQRFSGPPPDNVVLSYTLSTIEEATASHSERSRKAERALQRAIARRNGWERKSTPELAFATASQDTETGGRTHFYPDGVLAVMQSRALGSEYWQEIERAVTAEEFTQQQSGKTSSGSNDRKSISGDIDTSDLRRPIGNAEELLSRDLFPRHDDGTPTSTRRDKPGSRHTKYEIFPPPAASSHVTVPAGRSMNDQHADSFSASTSGTYPKPLSEIPETIHWSPRGGGGDPQTLTSRYNHRPPPPTPTESRETQPVIGRSDSTTSLESQNTTPPPPYIAFLEDSAESQDLVSRSSFIIDDDGVIQYVKPQIAGTIWSSEPVIGVDDFEEASSEDGPIRMSGRRRHGVI